MDECTHEETDRHGFCLECGEEQDEPSQGWDGDDYSEARYFAGWRV